MFKTAVLNASLCDYSDACYITVEGRITVAGQRANDAAIVADRNDKVVFKNCAPFTNCISKINEGDDAEELDIEMPIYNLLEYSDNYVKTLTSLWQYYRNEPFNYKSPNFP